MIVVTGAAGFIGSCMIARLNEEHFYDIVAVDDFSRADKKRNLVDKRISERVERSKFFNWLNDHHKMVQFVIHLGARTDTTEFDSEIHTELNLDYSKKVWKACCSFGLPLIYASSAATYGGGELGYEDDHSIISSLEPLNPYGVSKNEFDKWALEQEKTPYFWIGLKFFNVYGPNEYHKGRMASVILHAFGQIRKSGGMKLFRSHKSEYSDGGQKRDFVYVKDVLGVIMYLMQNRKPEFNGIYNMGSGKARTFNDLAASIFKAMDLPEQITYIDTPLDIRDKYQYFTEAPMQKLVDVGYSTPLTSLEEGVKDYVKQYLTDSQYY